MNSIFRKVNLNHFLSSVIVESYNIAESDPLSHDARQHCSNGLRMLDKLHQLSDEISKAAAEDVVTHSGLSAHITDVGRHRQALRLCAVLGNLRNYLKFDQRSLYILMRFLINGKESPLGVGENSGIHAKHLRLWLLLTGLPPLWEGRRMSKEGAGKKFLAEVKSVWEENQWLSAGLEEWYWRMKAEVGDSWMVQGCPLAFEGDRYRVFEH